MGNDITKHKTRSDKETVDSWEICSKRKTKADCMYSVILKVRSVQPNFILEMDKIPGKKYDQQTHNEPQPAAQNPQRERQ